MVRLWAASPLPADVNEPLDEDADVFIAGIARAVWWAPAAVGTFGDAAVNSQEHDELNTMLH